MDVVVGVCAFFFLFASWWMRTHEFWSTRDARELAEQNPTALRRANYRAEVLLSKWIAPIALAILGVVTLISALVP